MSSLGEDEMHYVTRPSRLSQFALSSLADLSADKAAAGDAQASSRLAEGQTGITTSLFPEEPATSNMDPEPAGMGASGGPVV